MIPVEWIQGPDLSFFSSRLGNRVWRRSHSLSDTSSVQCCIKAVSLHSLQQCQSLCRSSRRRYFSSDPAQWPQHCRMRISDLSRQDPRCLCSLPPYPGPGNLFSVCSIGIGTFKVQTTERDKGNMDIDFNPGSQLTRPCSRRSVA